MRVQGEIASNEVQYARTPFCGALTRIVAALSRRDRRLVKAVVLHHVADRQQLRAICAPCDCEFRIKWMCKVLSQVLEEQSCVPEKHLTIAHKLGNQIGCQPRLSPHRNQAEGVPWRHHCSWCATLDGNDANLQERLEQQFAIAVTLGVRNDGI